MNVCVIPARSGSQRIPGKNIKMFHGQPIIQYSIDTAKESGLFDVVIVSTDDQMIAWVAKQCGASIHMRSKSLSKDEVGTQKVAKSLLGLMGNVDYACVLYATSPLLSVDDLKRGLDRLKTSRTKKYAYSVDEEGVDCGNFYWGKAKSFIDNIPLSGNSVEIPIAQERVMDINTPADWMLAETKYTLLEQKYG